MIAAGFSEGDYEIVQEGPDSGRNSDILEQLASIGIQKRKPFKPDTRIQKVPVQASAVGPRPAHRQNY